MLFSKANSIELFRPALPIIEKLDVLVMMKALRKDEYLQLVYNMAGEIPDAKPIHLFKACVEILSNFSALDIQTQFLKIIKLRINLGTNQLIQDPNIPAALRLSCYHYNLSKNDYLSLIQRLSCRF